MLNFIVNKTGGGGKAFKRWNKLEKYLCASNIDYKVWFSERIKHAQEIAAALSSQKNEEKTKIVIVGGDGTINEVINGIKDFDSVQLGVIPAGSGNDFSRQFNIARHNPVKALKKILKSSGHKIDLGEASFITSDGNEKNLKFAISSGLGFDALICEKNECSKIKKVLNRMHMGKFSYIAITLHTLFSMETSDFTTYIEENEPIVLKNAVFLAAMNFKAEGGGVKMNPFAKEDDGKLSICAAYNIKKFFLPFKFINLMLGNHLKKKGFYSVDCSKLTVNSQKPVTIHTDGEFFTNINSISYKCLSEKIEVLV